MNHFNLEYKWTFVPNMKEILRGAPEIQGFVAVARKTHFLQYGNFDE